MVNALRARPVNIPAAGVKTAPQVSTTVPLPVKPRVLRALLANIVLAPVRLPTTTIALPVRMDRRADKHPRRAVAPVHWVNIVPLDPPVEQIVQPVTWLLRNRVFQV